MSAIRLWIVLAAASALMGCTHAMRIKNLDEFKKAMPVVQAPLVIGLKDESAPGDGQQLAKFVYEAMRTNPNVKQVVLPEQDGWSSVDAVVTLKPKADYSGSGWNYAITFPGFLLFTHAWNGYVYEADVVTEVAVELPHQTPINKQIQTRYSLRHCCFARGAATSSGWYLPGYGGTNLIVGFFMLRYDDHATPEFLKEVRPSYGEYIVASVIELVEQARSNSPPGAVQTSRGCPSDDSPAVRWCDAPKAGNASARAEQ